MKRFVLAVLAALGTAGFAAAQNGGIDLSSWNVDHSHRFTAAGEGIQLLTSANGDTVAVPRPSANPSPAPPAPKFFFGNSEDFRIQLGITYQHVVFRSTPFNANLNGIRTSLSYYLNDWLAVEGNTIEAFGTKVFGETAKYYLYTGGGRIAWRDQRRKYEPWMHFLVGGIHMIPQTALGGQNSFALQVGGGTDLRYNTRISFRFEGDYVRSQLYSESQNNFQFGAGLVLHF
jgi:hypothetical protein